jgi:hypothetical protein
LQAVALSTVIDQLGGATKLKLVILDACRNNSFPLAGAKRTTSRGLARVEPEDNTLIAYAAREGTVADDDPGRRHSPFTEALLKHVATQGIEVDYVFRLVRDDVVKTTSGQQTPHIYGTLGRERIYLKPLLPPAPTAPDLPPTLPHVSLTRPGSGSFDGTWYIRRKGPTCEFGQNVRFLVSVEGKVVRGLSAGFQKVAGAISASGDVSFRHATVDRKNNPDGHTAFFSGSLNRSSGAGTFMIPGGPCRGRFTASRSY